MRRKDVSIRKEKVENLRPIDVQASGKGRRNRPAPSITAALLTGVSPWPACMMRVISFHTFCKEAPALCVGSHSRPVQTRLVCTVVYDVWNISSAYVSHICCEHKTADYFADEAARAWLSLCNCKHPSVDTIHQLMAQISMPVTA